MIKAINSREFNAATQITTSEIRAKTQEDMDRRKKFLERSKILRDNLKDVVDSQLALMFAWESYEDMKPYIDVSNNLMRRIVQETSTLYKDEHERTVTPQSQQKAYEEAIGEEGLRLNSKFKTYQETLNGLNDIIIKTEGSTGMLDATVFTPDQVTVFENPLNPLMLDAIIIEDCYRDMVSGLTKRRWIFWSPVRHFILDDQYRMQPVGDNFEMLNPYWAVNMEKQAFYPFIGVHNGERDRCFWDTTTGTDLVEATKTIAIKNTFLYFMFPMQFKQLGAEGTFDDKSEFKNRQIKSPLHVMKSNQKLTVLDWQSSLKELDDRIQSQLFQVASNYGISAENFKLTATETSGFARMIAKERLMEIRQQQIPTWRQVEGEMFDNVRVTKSVYSIDKPISDTAKFAIDFKEPQMLEDPMAELELQEKRMDMGLTNPLEIIKAENPDIKTDEEAEEFLAKNIAIRNRLKSKFSLAPLGGGANQNQPGNPPGNQNKGQNSQ